MGLGLFHQLHIGWKVGCERQELLGLKQLIELLSESGLDLDNDGNGGRTEGGCREFGLRNRWGEGSQAGQ